MAASQTTSSKAGDVNIERINVVAPDGFFQDITNQVIGIQIFEDIYSPFITGSLIIKDSLDLINLFPFVGEEYIDIKITTPRLKKIALEGKFQIFKIVNREMTGDRSLTYEMHFITQEALVDLNKKISKTYSGKCSDIAKTLMTDTFFGLQLSRPTFAEETINSTKFTANYWSPIKCINYLCSNAMNKNKSPSYVFFENRVGFNFVSLETLYNNNDPVQEFYYDKWIRDERPGGGTTKNIAEEYKRIRELNMPQVFDYMDRIQSGMHGSRLWTHDITSKVYSSKNYDMFEDARNNKKLNPNLVSSKLLVYRYNSLIMNMPKAFNSQSNYGDVTNTGVAQKRLSLMKQADSSKLQITVPGRVDYTVGQKVVVNLDKMEPIRRDETDTIDRMFSGQYIIGAINHFITRREHECVMELFKDSLLENLDDTSKKRPTVK